MQWLASQAESAGGDLAYAPEPEPVAAPRAPAPAPAAPAARVPGTQYPAAPPGTFPGYSALPMQPQKTYSLPEPPQRERPNTAMTMLAAFADLAINNGRGGAQILQPLINDESREYENYQRRVQAAKDEAALNAQTQRSGGMGDQLAWLRFQQGERRLGNAEDAAQKKAEYDAALRQMNSPETKEIRAAAIAAGSTTEAEASRMNGFQLLTFRPQMGQEAAQIRSFGNQYKQEDYKQGNRQEMFNQRVEANQAAAERQATLRREAEGRGFREKFSKDRETELDIAGLMQDIEATPGGAPPGFWERFRSSLTARNISPDRLENWQAKQMILELWSRNASGAAISKTEDGKFVTQVGMDWAASPEQVEAAYAVMGRLIGRRLRGFASSDPENARAVGDEYGLDTNRWFGAPAQAAEPEPQQPRRPRTPRAPIPADPDADDDAEDEDDLLKGL